MRPGHRVRPGPGQMRAAVERVERHGARRQRERFLEPLAPDFGRPGYTIGRVLLIWASATSAGAKFGVAAISSRRIASARSSDVGAPFAQERLRLHPELVPPPGRARHLAAGLKSRRRQMHIQRHREQPQRRLVQRRHPLERRRVPLRPDAAPSALVEQHHPDQDRIALLPEQSEILQRSTPDTSVAPARPARRRSPASRGTATGPPPSRCETPTAK
jgi:hypothetical protein